ncbi:thermostable hemolysin [Marinobacter sp. M216]|uniref:Thermostable hemolysin n=1 Tax=Marinobacter albus TaxID=3030833 RepID=A0ABT7HE23_9GAMM|nr:MULTISPECIES: thermostable hemolysin [unclassified Marinobacter]MBW7472041.1 thermostable hemolysin [Marinobacter sp. F4218]MDK9558611.1 thermostable hemolysin [Marinobacter sp. M216]
MSDPLMMSACCPPDSDEVEPVIRCAGRWLCRVDADTRTAAEVGQFIRRRFLLAYGAQPSLRIPDLLVLTTAHGSLLAAVGVRNAASESLFLEDYLGEPVENRMPEPGPGRQAIAEIAHLAGVEAGVSRYLFASLAVWLDGAGYQWVVCTGTDQLRNSFRRLGIDTHVLADADPARLADGGAGWGRYYDHHPVVMAVSVAESLAALKAAGLLKVTFPVNGNDAERGNQYGCIA